MKYKIKGSEKKNAKVNLVKKDQSGSKLKPVVLKGPTITPPKPVYATSEQIMSKTDLVGPAGKEVPQATNNYKTVYPKKANSNLLVKKKQGGTLDISNILAIWKK